MSIGVKKAPDNQPILTLITVCKNSSVTIGETLKSVASQEQVDGLLEHIVIDGASTDQTMEIVKSFPHVKWISEPDNGIADAFNKGIRLATGRIIGFVHSDDRLSGPLAARAVIDAFESNKNARVVVGKISVDGAVFDGGNSLIRSVVRRFLKLVPSGDLFGEFVPHPAMFVKREVYEELGDYDESFKIAMDYEFIIRLRKMRVRTDKIPEVVYEMSSAGISNVMQERAAIESFKACRKHGIFMPLALTRLIMTISIRYLSKIVRIK